VSKLQAKAYTIARVEKRADRDVDVIIEGPGMPPAGGRYVLATIERGKILVDALNLAYENGFNEGATRALHPDGRTALE
jgi:hypothetical protein